MNRAVAIALTLIALCGLAGCASKQKERVHAMVKTLREGAPPRRVYAADSLGNIGLKAEGCVEALAEALDDENLIVRSHAAYSLGKIGPDAKDALPALDKAMARPMASVEEVRRSMDEALPPGKTDPEKRGRVEALMNAVDLTPIRAAMAISLIDTESDRGVKMILAALKDPTTHENVKKEAAFALGRIGPRTGDVVPALRAAAGQGGTLAMIAKDALREIAERSREGG